MNRPLSSIVIRTFNEQLHLDRLLATIAGQRRQHVDVEVVLVDSGSTDRTLQIAEKWGCRIVHIGKEQFTFGRSLNMGCEAARGEFLVFVSGHCIPANENWLDQLCAPLMNGLAAYSYGGQLGDDDSKFSERQLFRKYFPDANRIPQEGFFCNNANAALSSAYWSQHKFNEELTGLEDMELAKRLCANGLKVAYVADAAVYHLHDEGWRQIKRRYEREALALQAIMPQIHISFADFLRYFVGGVLLDWGAALQERKLRRVALEVALFRFMQFWGSYRGNNEHRRLSREMKERYFYPATQEHRLPRKPGVASADIPPSKANT